MKVSAIMEWELKNNVVVITGGAMGIGYQIANSFLANGAKTVIILDIEKKTGEEAIEKLNKIYGEEKAIFMKCDVTKDLEVISNNIFQKHKVDILVNNAGILDETDLRKTIEINVIAVVEWGMKFWEQMRKDNGGEGGTILNLASIYGYESDPWLNYYKASKHAVMGFTKTLGHLKNFERSGVRVIAMCPGYTDTKILQAKLTDYHAEEFSHFLDTQVIQKVETVGQAAVDIFKVADSGTAWVVRDEQPIEPIPLHY